MNQLARVVLLVLPVSLMEHWKSTLDKWAPEMNVFSFYGSTSYREKEKRKVWKNGGILLTSYKMLLTNVETLLRGRSQENGLSFFAFVSSIFHPTVTAVWDYVILDEGHTIKNPSAKGTKTIKNIPSHHRLLLTGTPIQNNLHEMWSLFDYVCPRLLGTSRQFIKEFETPIRVGSHKKASKEEVRFGRELASQLRQIIDPYFLRREKSVIFPTDNSLSPSATWTGPTSVSHHKNGAMLSTHILSSSELDARDNEFKTETISSPSAKVGQNTPTKKVKNEVKPNDFTLRSKKNDFIVWVFLSDAQIRLYTDFLSSPVIKEALNSTKFGSFSPPPYIYHFSN